MGFICSGKNRNEAARLRNLRQIHHWITQARQKKRARDYGTYKFALKSDPVIYCGPVTGSVRGGIRDAQECIFCHYYCLESIAPGKMIWYPDLLRSFTYEVGRGTPVPTQLSRLDMASADAKTEKPPRASPLHPPKNNCFNEASQLRRQVVHAI